MKVCNFNIKSKKINILTCFKMGECEKNEIMKNANYLNIAGYIHMWNDGSLFGIQVTFLRQRINVKIYAFSHDEIHIFVALRKKKIFNKNLSSISFDVIRLLLYPYAVEVYMCGYRTSRGTKAVRIRWAHFVRYMYVCTVRSPIYIHFKFYVSYLYF